MSHKRFNSEISMPDLDLLNFIVKAKPLIVLINTDDYRHSNSFGIMSSGAPIDTTQITKMTFCDEFFDNIDAYNPQEKEFLSKLNHLRMYQKSRPKNSFMLRTLDLLLDIFEAVGLTDPPFKMMYYILFSQQPQSLLLSLHSTVPQTNGLWLLMYSL
jgi:hypothetical protein